MDLSSYRDRVKCLKIYCRGFTLAELLIALGILGVIATFTIPKILDSSSDEQFRAVAKEAAGMVSGAYQSYKLDNGPSPNATIGDLTPYLNYVKTDNTTNVDGSQTQGVHNCSNAAWVCLRLHSGAMLFYPIATSFGGTASTNCLWFRLDPDGKYSGSTTGPGKSVDFYIYYNGGFRNHGTVITGSASSSGAYAPNAALDPPWFSWN